MSVFARATGTSCKYFVENDLKWSTEMVSFCRQPIPVGRWTGDDASRDYIADTPFSLYLFFTIVNLIFFFLLVFVPIFNEWSRVLYCK